MAYPMSRTAPRAGLVSYLFLLISVCSNGRKIARLNSWMLHSRPYDLRKLNRYALA